MRRRGRMRLANSDTMVRPMRHVSDTKNFFRYDRGRIQLRVRDQQPRRGPTLPLNARLWH